MSGRASLACLSCRSAKSKCGGIVPSAIGSLCNKNLVIVPADQPCHRCQRLNLACQWRSVNRTGRPKKCEMSIKGSSLQSSPTMEDIEAFNDEELFQVFANSLGETQEGGSEDLSHLFTFLDDEGINLNFSAPSSSVVQAPDQIVNASPVSTQLQQINQSPPHAGALQQQRNTLETGLHLYFLSLGRSSPLVGLEGDLMARINSCQEILLQSIAAIGHLLFEGCESQAYIQARRIALRLSLEEPSIEDPQTILDFCMAMILISYLEYGANNIQEASRCMEKASQFALLVQLNTLDIQDNTATQSMSFFAHLCKANDQIMETGRRVWWELLIAEIVLEVATSGKITPNLDSESKTVVHTPCIPGSNDREAYQMRIKAALLMKEILNAVQDAPLGSLDSILGNMISSVQDRWLSFSLRVRNESNTVAQSTFTSQSILFQALLMLNAARLHLHRQAWFPSVTLDYDTCSFQSKDPLINHSIKTGSASTSLDQIIKCSTSILQLMQLDSELHFRLVERYHFSQVPLISPHWPFIGCCQMAASFGFAMATTFSTTNCTTTITTPATSSQISTVDLWKRREDLSKLGFAEATLGNLMQVWKVAGEYRDEIYRCRMAIEQS